MEKEITYTDCFALQAQLMETLRKSSVAPELEKEIDAYDKATKSFLGNLQKAIAKSRELGGSLLDETAYGNVLDDIHHMLSNTVKTVNGIGTIPKNPERPALVSDTEIIRNLLDLDIRSMGIYQEALATFEVFKSRVVRGNKTLQ